LRNNGEPIDKKRIKSMATNVLDCADTNKGLVNGVRQDDDHVAVCLGGRDACGDCFDGGLFFSGSSFEDAQFS
jgi:hypothetical protein